MVRPTYRAQIIATLKDHGRMTAAEIADCLSLEIRTVATAIASARNQKPGVIFRVVAYRPVTGRRAADASVYVAEAGADVLRQAFTKSKQAKRRALAKTRYREKHRQTINMRNSIRRAERAGRSVVINPWLQLASPRARPTMARIANEMRAAV